MGSENSIVRRIKGLAGVGNPLGAALRLHCRARNVKVLRLGGARCGARLFDRGCASVHN
jgi:hypothetical protein